MELTITIKNPSEREALFGPANRNLRLLRDQLEVALVARDESLRISEETKSMIKEGKVMSNRSLVVENALVWGSRAEYNFTTLEDYIIELEAKQKQFEKMWIIADRLREVVNRTYEGGNDIDVYKLKEDDLWRACCRLVTRMDVIEKENECK